jgi:integrase
MFPNIVQDAILSPRQQSLIPLEQYHRQTELEVQEQKALARAAAYFAGQRRTALPPDLQPQLVRLLGPLTDITIRLGIPTKHSKVYLPVMLLEMHQCSASYWSWSEEQWTKLIETSVLQFSQDANQDLRRFLLLFAYIVGPQTDFFLPLLEGMLPFSLASTLFGKEALDSAVERVLDALKIWGFEVTTDNTRKCLKTTLAEVLLVNRSSLLEDITLELLATLREKMLPYKRATLERISKALTYLGIIEGPLPSLLAMKRIPPERVDSDGIAPEWVAWCLRWYHFSCFIESTKRHRLGCLFRTGRWLAQVHPEVTSPEQWDAKLAAEYVATVDQMKVGDFAASEYLERMKVQRDERAPLLAATKRNQLDAIRTFFLDLQEDPHTLPRRFDPTRAFRTPRSIANLIGPNPRDLSPLIWAKMVYAALNLTEEDLPRGSHGVIQYPLAMVRAIAAVWVYSGLRADEIARLRLGCIRWQQEDVKIPETGEVLPKEAVCFLTVPVNKTTTAFQKPVNPIIGQRINEWEQVRAIGQAHYRDRKTGEKIDYLFIHRGQPVSKHYLNNTLIPLLCARAGIPRVDERGSITSHRARATLATLLYNAPEGLSILELMQWLGHKDPKTTQHYARITPTKLAAAYSKAERNSRLIEALIDTKADANGDVNIYYVLGDHGLCSNPDWATCLYRMACIKCPFFVPKDQAQLIEACKTVKRFMEVVELTDEELVAVQEDCDKLKAAVERTQHLQVPTILRRRVKGSTQRGIPLTVLNSSLKIDEV